VGGGYIKIDEFIETFTSLEIEKIERKEVINRFHLNSSKSALENNSNRRQRSP